MPATLPTITELPAEMLEMLMPVLLSGETAVPSGVPTLLFSMSKVTLPFAASETSIPWLPWFGDPWVIVLFRIVTFSVELSAESALIAIVRLPDQEHPATVAVTFAEPAASRLRPTLPIVELLFVTEQPAPPIVNEVSGVAVVFMR